MRNRVDALEFEPRRGGPLLAVSTLTIVNASTSGLSLRASDGVSNQLVQKVITGTLKTSSGLSIPMQVQVRHVGSSSDSWDGRTLGCGFQNIGHRNQVAISAALLELHERTEARRAANGAAQDAEAEASALRLAEPSAGPTDK